jgi:hypothetical protein
VIESAPTIEQLAESLASDLHSKGIESEFARELAQQLAQEFAVYDIPPAKPGTLGFLVGRYAIRKDEFKIFDALTDGLKAAAAVSFFATHQPVIGANVALGVSLAKLLRSIAMRGAMIDPDSVVILALLKSAVGSPDDEGLTANEILTMVSSTRPNADLAWVQQRLDRLKEFPTRDGAAAKLASSDSAGRWRSHA